MIGKVIRGWNPKKLTWYLMGPGESNEHTRPTVIAAWDGNPAGLQPSKVGPGDFDFDADELASLVGHLYAPAEAVGFPVTQPEPGDPFYNKRGYVWHLPVSIEAEAGTLDHDTWAQIARDVMDRTGIDAAGCRWIAIHHGQSTEGNDHIHIAATLVSQSTGERFTPKGDYFAVGAVMREWEQRLGLRVLDRSDRSAEKVATRSEHEKAARQASNPDRVVPSRTDATETVRGQLRQVVSEAADTATDSESFLAELRKRGLLVNLHRNRAGDVDGYSVALRGNTTAAGKPIFFGGGSLARDLSWPKVNAEFARHGGVIGERPTDRNWDLTAEQLRGARDVVGRATRGFASAPYAAQRDIAVAAHRMVTSYSKVTAGNRGADNKPDPTSGRIRAVWAGHRSARAARLSPHGRSSTPAGPLSKLADDLNGASRGLLAMRAIGEGGAARTASLELVIALAELMVEIAAWHEARHPGGAGPSARACVGALREHAEKAATHPLINAVLPSARAAAANRGPTATMPGRGAGGDAPTPGARRTDPPAARARDTGPPGHLSPHRRPPTPPPTGPTR